jgi:hypothetical protein
MDDMPDAIQESSYRLSGKISFAAGRAEDFFSVYLNSFDR